MTDTPKKVGRPPEPVPEAKAQEVLDWLYEGGSLYGFCRQEGKPKLRTIYDWCDKDEVFAARFARAREVGADALAYEALEIADDTSRDTITRVGKDGQEVDAPDHEWISRSKLRVDQRMRMAACFCPRLWGQKASIEHAGGVKLEVVTGVPRIDSEEP